MNPPPTASGALAAAITRSASTQTYTTIRLLVDRPRVADAYRAYAYYRWVDDVLDAPAGEGDAADRAAFLRRQQSLLADGYRGAALNNLRPEEQMLADLIASDRQKHSGLQAYLRNMMAVMCFDVNRRGRMISQAELNEYTRLLATAVTEALHYYIGSDEPTSYHPHRYLSVTGAHIVHMLRDAVEDAEAGYFNIPREALAQGGFAPHEVYNPAYRAWVRERVKLARRCFQAGRMATAQVRSARLRAAGFAYTARFEWMLRAIERDGYCLRAAYPERKSVSAGLWMAGNALASLFPRPTGKLQPTMR
jgi:phytoene/squalene synthetase